MTDHDRAALNRRAAELAGWRFAPFTTTADDGEAFEWLRITLPDGGEQVWGLIRPDGWDYEAETPGFLADPALWWPLVERMARLAEERPTYEWHGPLYRPAPRRIDRKSQRSIPAGPSCWFVQVRENGRSQRFVGETAGEAAVRGALALAEALGLGPEEGPTDAD